MGEAISGFEHGEYHDPQAGSMSDHVLWVFKDAD